MKVMVNKVLTCRLTGYGYSPAGQDLAGLTQAGFDLVGCTMLGYGLVRGTCRSYYGE